MQNNGCVTEWSKVVDSRSTGIFLMGSNINFPITTNLLGD